MPQRLPAAAAARSHGARGCRSRCFVDVIDTDGGGDLDEQETKRYLSVLGTGKPSWTRAGRRCLPQQTQMATAGVDREEFLTYILKDESSRRTAFVSEEREAELTEAIIMLQMIHHHHMGPAAELAGALFDVIDADGGGDLDEQETKRYLSVLGTAEAELDARWSTMLAAADTDGDGMIDRSS